MSIRVLADDSDTAPHGPADDLESFLYAFLAICITCTGPASSPTIPTASTILATWDGYKPYTELAQAKMEQMSNEASFERVLDDFAPYESHRGACTDAGEAVLECLQKESHIVGWSLVAHPTCAVHDASL